MNRTFAERRGPDNRLRYNFFTSIPYARNTVNSNFPTTVHIFHGIVIGHNKWKHLPSH